VQLNVRDAAQLLNVSEKTIYRWIGRGELPAFRVNEQYRFNRAELLEWATKRKIAISPEIVEEPESSAVPLPSLTEALSAGGILYRVGGTDRDAVLRNIVTMLHLPEEVDRDFLYKVLLARENLQSTGIGDGIAIPHVRNPIVLHVARPTVTLCFLEQPVDFHAIDGKPVFAVFTVISPTVRGHLHLLSRLAIALRDPGFRAAVDRRSLREELLQEARRVEAASSRTAPAGDTTTPPGGGRT
jgi:PTS system nitrogen regulatory IIA component